VNSLPVGPSCLLLAQTAVPLAVGQIKIYANSCGLSGGGMRFWAINMMNY